MKNTLPIILFFILFFTDFFTNQLHLLPRLFTWLPEFFYAIIAMIITARIIEKKTISIPIKYWLIFICFIYIVIAGIIINEISTLTVIAGIRVYFKFIPIFLLPLAFDYSINDLKKQFLALLLLGILQLPVSIWQKFILEAHNDLVSGTLNSSNALSIMMISIILMLLTFYLRKLIRLRTLTILLIVLFLPATLNETKVTPILLTAGFIALLLIMRKEITFKKFAVFSTGGFLLLSMFILIYNALYSGEDDSTFSENLTNKNYNFHDYKADSRAIFNTDSIVVGEQKNLPASTSETGRIDSILIPLDILSNKDFIKLIFGLGIGNVSSAGANSTYNHLTTLKGNQTTLALLLWETGIFGAFTFTLLLIFFSRDAYLLARDSSKWRTFSSGWFAISIVLLITLGYNNLFTFDELTALYMYFSGIIILKRHATLKSLKKKTH